MEKTTLVKIDQLTLNLPYRLVSIQPHIPSKLPLPVQTVDSLLKLSTVFSVSTLANGQNGYTNRFVYGNSAVSVMWNSERKDMGILVAFTATGKKYYEEIGKIQEIKIDWQDIIKKIVKDGGHLTRIDIAVDLINYDFSLTQLTNQLAENKSYFTNKRNQVIPKNRISIIGKPNRTETIYVGSRTSDAFLRLYNKKIEQSKNPASIYHAFAKENKSWLRIEAEFKHRLAQEIGRAIASWPDKNNQPKLAAIIFDRWSLITEKNLAPEWQALKETTANNEINLKLPARFDGELIKKIQWFINHGPLNILFLIQNIFGPDALEDFFKYCKTYIEKENAALSDKKIHELNILRENCTISDFKNILTELKNHHSNPLN